MSHGVPYLNWRDGRPRWEPGPYLRKDGWRGQDLKNQTGNWLPLDQALNAARTINECVVDDSKEWPTWLRLKEPVTRYLYFIQSGGAWKIGCSRDPIGIANSMSKSTPYGAQCVVCTPGTEDQLESLHLTLSRHMIHRDWFENCDKVREAIFQSINLGHPTTVDPKTGRS